MFLQQLVNGLTLGGIYALVAVGYTMVYGIAQLINFAHGEILMMGAFLAYTFILYLHLSYFQAFVLAVGCSALLGMLLDVIAYRPLRRSPRLAALITAIGASLFFQNIAQVIWGANTRPYPAESIPSFFGEMVFSVVRVDGGIRMLWSDVPERMWDNPSLEIVAQVSAIQVFVVLLAAALMAVLHLVVHRTTLGMAMRACAQNRTAAALMGIDVNRVITATFAIGSAMGAVAGIVIGTYYGALFPTMGYRIGIVAFAAAVLGGIGNIPGAMLGGLVLGLAESYGASYLSSEYRYGIAYAIMIGVIVFKPAGLLGSAEHPRK